MPVSDSGVTAHPPRTRRETLLGGTASLLAFALGPGVWEGLIYGEWTLVPDSIIVMLLGAIWFVFPLFLPYLGAFLLARYGRVVAARARIGLPASLVILGLGGGGLLGGAASWLFLPSLSAIGTGLVWGVWAAWPAVLLVWHSQRHCSLPPVRPLHAGTRRMAWIAVGTLGSLAAYVGLFLATATAQDGFHPLVIIMMLSHPMALYPAAATLTLFSTASRFARLVHWTPQLAVVLLYLVVLPPLSAPFWLPAAMDGAPEEAGLIFGLIMGSCIPAVIAAWCGLRAGSEAAGISTGLPQSPVPDVNDGSRTDERVV